MTTNFSPSSLYGLFIPGKLLYNIFVYRTSPLRVPLYSKKIYRYTFGKKSITQRKLYKEKEWQIMFRVLIVYTYVTCAYIYTVLLENANDRLSVIYRCTLIVSPAKLHIFFHLMVFTTKVDLLYQVVIFWNNTPASLLLYYLKQYFHNTVKSVYI